METKRCISSLTLEQLTAELKAMGQPGFRAKQIFHWVHQKLVTDFSAMTDQPKALLAKLEEAFYIAAPIIERRQEAKDGTVMRFIIIKKNGGAYGIGLDACENCGDAGYYEKDGKIICKKCEVAINLATIGFKGGCNPIPFPYKTGSGKITIQTADLDALSAHFQ